MMAKVLFLHIIYNLVDESVERERINRDKGYSGSATRRINATMDRAARKKPPTIDQVRRNRRITKKRSPGERPYSVMKRIFHGGHVFVTMIRRLRVKV